MKKLLKIFVAFSAIIGGIAGILYFLDKKNSDEKFDDFDDADFDDVFGEDDSRDYVTLDFDNETEQE